VGEFLESLGNKKSEVVVTAMIAYIKAHPEVLNKDNPVKVIAAFGYSEETLQAKIKELVYQVTGKSTSAPMNRVVDNTFLGGQPDSTLDNETAGALDLLLNSLEQFE